ncbi:hypothetical protein ACMD2_08888 [Ananas comosus]|uniref:Uncharacterized protein n=1 Tax=Ananas comosus TaxID=4615 RepID=A0A199UY46_ANACO|nr:hypothetical protein ACMD2_08888 [Ananas comosus]
MEPLSAVSGFVAYSYGKTYSYSYNNTEILSRALPHLRRLLSSAHCLPYRGLDLRALYHRPFCGEKGVHRRPDRHADPEHVDDEPLVEELLGVERPRDHRHTGDDPLKTRVPAAVRDEPPDRRVESLLKEGSAPTEECDGAYVPRAVPHRLSKVADVVGLELVEAVHHRAVAPPVHRHDLAEQFLERGRQLAAILYLGAEHHYSVGKAAEDDGVAAAERGGMGGDGAEGEETGAVEDEAEDTELLGYGDCPGAKKIGDDDVDRAYLMEQAAKRLTESGHGGGEPS